jgi:hypothetical protein
MSVTITFENWQQAVDYLFELDNSDWADILTWTTLYFFWSHQY